MAREFAKAFYKSDKWAKARAYALSRDNYICQKCGRPAEEVHHRVWLTASNIADPSISLDPDKLISLCRDCHFGEHRGMARGRGQDVYIFDDDGQPRPKKPERD